MKKETDDSSRIGISSTTGTAAQTWESESRSNCLLLWGGIDRAYLIDDAFNWQSFYKLILEVVASI